MGGGSSTVKNNRLMLGNSFKYKNKHHNPFQDLQKKYHISFQESHHSFW